MSWEFCCSRDFFLHLIKHFYSYRLVFYLLFHEEDNDNSEHNNSLLAMALVLDTTALKQDVILIFYCYLGQTIIALFFLHCSLTLQVLTAIWASQKKKRNFFENIVQIKFCKVLHFLYLALYRSVTHQANSHLSLFTNQ